MDYLVLIIPLVVLILISFYLNSKKIYDRTGHKYLVSFMEGLGSYLIVFSLLFEGFVANPVFKIVIFLIGFAIVVFSNNNINDSEPELDVQAETLKNLFVIFVSTILLFYVLLSVFRFQPFYLQILYALVGVVIFNVFAYFARKMTSNIFDIIDFRNAFVYSYKWIYFYFIVFILAFSIILINMPKVAINTAINLNDSKSYYLYPDGSNKLINRFESEKLLNLDIDEDFDQYAFMNHSNQYILIHLNQSVVIYDTELNLLVYHGPVQDLINGIHVDRDNQEENEIRYQSVCGDALNCIEYDFIFEYGGISYTGENQILMFNDLTYESSDTAIFYDEVIHFFIEEEIDSRHSTKTDKPFIGFGESKTRLSDIDFRNGEIVYLQVKETNEGMNLTVYKTLERDIDLYLPFYSHYRFGMLVFIFLMGLIPISNYDAYRTVINYNSKVNEK